MTERKTPKRRVGPDGEDRRAVHAARRHVAAAAPAADEPEPAHVPAPRTTPSFRATGRTWSEWFAVLDAWGATSSGRTARSPATCARSTTFPRGGRRASRSSTRAPAAACARSYDARGRLSVAREQDRRRARGAAVRRLRSPTIGPALPRRRAPRPDDAAGPVGAAFDWEDGRTRVVVGFTAKGDAKSTIALEHERLADAEEGVERDAARSRAANAWRSWKRLCSRGEVWWKAAALAAVVVLDLALGDFLQGHGQVVLRARLDERRRGFLEAHALTELVVVVVDLPRALRGDDDERVARVTPPLCRAVRRCEDGSWSGMVAASGELPFDERRELRHAAPARRRRSGPRSRSGRPARAGRGRARSGRRSRRSSRSRARAAAARARRRRRR